MYLGVLDRRVNIEQKVVTQDATYGTEVITWTLLATVWANVQDALPSKSESVLQGLAVALNQVRVRIRYRSDVNSAMRITIKGDTDRVLQIVGGPSELGRRDGIEIMCESVST